MKYKFKGTKSKKDWQYEYDGDGMRFKGVSVYVDDCYENYRADSQAISQVPQMIKYLINRFNHLDEQGLNLTSEEYKEWNELDNLLNDITTY